MSVNVYGVQTAIPRLTMFRAWDALGYLSAEIHHSMEQLDSKAAADRVEVDWWGSLAITVRYDGLLDATLLTVRATGEPA